MRTLRIFILIIFISACSGSKPNDELSENDQELAEEREDFEYSLLFGTIDSRVKIFVNDEEIASLEAIKNEPEQLGLDPFLTKGENKVRIELYNGNGNLDFDKKWAIYYELFKRTEPIEFANEKSSNGDQGLVFSNTHEIQVK